MKSNHKYHPKYQLSIILVNYNAGNFLMDSLKSLQGMKDEADFNIWVVDNASTDNSLAKCQKLYPDIKYIQNRENLGFGAANNLALQQVLKNSRNADEEYILLLNPDTRVLPGTISCLLNYLHDHPEAGVVTPKLIHEDGSLDWAAHRGLPTPLSSFLYFLGDDRLYHLSDRNLSVEHEVDAVSGSFLLTRITVLGKVGLFDEDYWLYGEDLDLCFRIKKAGFKIIYHPAFSVVHLKGISSGIKIHTQAITTASNQSKIKAFNSFYQTMKIFYQKNLAKNYPFFINWLVFIAIDLKWFVARRNLKV